MAADLVLGLDLTTSCGWAVTDLNGRTVDSGVLDLRPGNGDHEGLRWVAFRGKLVRLLGQYRERLCAIGYERPSTQQWATARLAFGQAALVELEASRDEIPTVDVSPSTIKKIVAGHGRASKEDVVAAVERATGPMRGRGGTPRGDKLRSDEADAIGVCLVLVRAYSTDDLRRRVLVRRPSSTKKTRRRSKA